MENDSSEEVTLKGKKILVAFDWHDHRVYQGIAQFCTENDWHLSPYFFSDRRVPENWPADGAITCHGEHLDEFVCGLDMPLIDVTINSFDREVPRVVVDNEQICARAAEHFLQRGYRQFCFFSWDIVGVNRVRKKLFNESLEAAGVKAENIHQISQPDGEVIRDYQAHMKAIIDQVKKLPRPVAIFTGQDNLAVTLVDACVNAGISVPDEVAVLGVDNIEFLCECAAVPTSSIDTHLEDLGYTAAEQLGRLMCGEIENSEPVRKISVGEVVKRRSTSALAVSHAGVAEALHMMRTQFSTGLTLEDIYAQVGLSKRGLEKAFKRHLDRSPASVLRQIRLDYAKVRLTQSNVKIEAIAMDCGYSNSSNLSHAFSREVGISPHAYRNKYRSSLHRADLGDY